MRGYPWTRQVLVLLPTLVLVTVMFLAFSDEQGVEDYFTGLRLKRPESVRWVEKFSALANIPYYLVYAAILAKGLVRRDWSRGGFVAGYLLSLVMILVMTKFVKFAVGRPRPYTDDPFEPFVGGEENQSFPSGHVTETFTTVGPLAMWFGGVGVPLLLGMAPVLMGLARLYLGEHHPTDFLGSIAMGTLGALLARFFAGVIVARVGKRPAGEDSGSCV